MELLSLFPWAERDEYGYPSENQDFYQKVLRYSKRSGRIENVIQITLQVVYLIMKQSVDGTTMISLGFTGGTMAYRELWEKYLEHSADSEDSEEFQNAIEMIVDATILTRKEREKEKRVAQLEQQLAVARQQASVISQQRVRVGNP